MKDIFYEKNKITTLRVIFLVLLLACFILTIVSCRPATEIEIVSDEGSLKNYYEYSDESECTITVKFNENVDKGSITVTFYDDDGNISDKQTKDFTSWDVDDKTVELTFFNVKGRPASYKVTDFTAEPPMSLVSILILEFAVWLALFIIMVSSFAISCKIYDFNGNAITVYSGWFSCYVKVNGVTVTKKSSILRNFFFARIFPTYLSTTLPDGVPLLVKINFFNGIKMWLNGSVYNKEYIKQK